MTPSSNDAQVAVIGAGLAGLSAAYRLRKRDCRITVFESSGRVGGRVQSVRQSGYIADTGASALAESYSAYFSLAAELGLRARIRPTQPCIGIYRAGRIHLLDLDHILRSALTTRVLSGWSKLVSLRLTFDILRAKMTGKLDYNAMHRAAPLDIESSDAYARRRLNAEINDYLVSPIIRTMLIAAADRSSKVELFSGVANIFGAKLYALEGGQGYLCEKLAEEVAPRLASEVTRVQENSDHVLLEIRSADGVSTQRFNACIVCCPLPAAAQICIDKQALLQPFNSALTYTQAITVAVGTTRRQASPAVLVQMPACEDANVALFFLEHNKAQDRAPVGKGLTGCQWDAEASARMMGASDEEIVQLTLASLFRVFPELRGCVDFTHVARWPRALPLTDVGIYARIGEFLAKQNMASRIQFASDYMGEAGQNTVIALGARAAATVLALLGSHSG